MRENAAEYSQTKRLLLPVDYTQSKGRGENTPMRRANNDLVELQNKINRGLQTIAKNFNKIPEIIIIDDDMEQDGLAEAIGHAVGHRSGFSNQIMFN